MTLSDWTMRARGIDFAAPWRGTYATEAECNAILREAGGLKSLLARVLMASGFNRVSEPRTGDIALVRGPVAQDGAIRQLPAGAICVDGKCAVLTRDMGLVIAPLPVIRAWGI